MGYSPKRAGDKRKGISQIKGARKLFLLDYFHPPAGNVRSILNVLYSSVPSYLRSTFSIIQTAPSASTTPSLYPISYHIYIYDIQLTHITISETAIQYQFSFWDLRSQDGYPTARLDLLSDRIYFYFRKVSFGRLQEFGPQKSKEEDRQPLRGLHYPANGPAIQPIFHTSLCTEPTQRRT